MDEDRDGRLNIRELKAHIRNFQCRNIPEHLANHILKMSDEDSDGALDFEEFYRLSLRQEWLFSRLIFNYCKMIVPSPHRPEHDETGKDAHIHFHLNGFSFLKVKVLLKFSIPNEFCH